MPTLLYLSAVGTKVELTDLSSVEGSQTFDMDHVRQSIVAGLKAYFIGCEVVEAADLVHDGVPVAAILAKPYDLVICDVTISNANILYLAGAANALGMPIIYLKSNKVEYPMVLEGRKILSYSERSLSKQFQSALNRAVDKALKDPSELTSTAPTLRRTRVFISYSHLDRPYLDRLLVHLKPLIRSDLLDVWVDTNVKAGDRWEEAIQSALKSASVAILLVSADFLASDFIVENELPPLLLKAEVDGTKVIPLIVSPCRFARDQNLSQFQAANSPTQPLSSLSHAEREAVFDTLANEIERALHSVG